MLDRKSLRLAGYDYASAGAYFITLVTRNREALFKDEQPRSIIEECWLWLAEQYDYVTLDEYIVMPNHLHGLIWITNHRRGGSRAVPTAISASKIKPLGELVGAFKTVSTQRINTLRSQPGLQIWQRDFYDRIVRDEEELNRIRQYIIDNPSKWDEDPENPTQLIIAP